MNVDMKIKSLVDSYGDWFSDFNPEELPEMTKHLYPYKHLFSPIEINRLVIKNRIMMGPMGNICMCDETGRPNEQMISYFEERAKGGVGLLSTGLIPTSQGIDPTVAEPDKLSYFPRIDRSRSNFAAWRDLAAKVNNYGSKIFIQLTPGLGRVGNPQCLLTLKKFPRSASLNPNFYMPQIPCLPLSTRSLKKIIRRTGQAAADAKAAGINGIYLHGHEGYLLEQLTNPAFNRRSLGRYSDWQLFGIDLVKEIRDRVGNSFPIMYRIDLSLALEETYGEKMNTVKFLKKFKGGRTGEMTLDYMTNLVSAGIDIFDVDLGCYDNWWLPHPPSSMPPGCFLEVSSIVKNYFAENNIKSNAGKLVPVVAVGKLGYPDLAEKALREEKCDMIMLARPLLADPHWANKAFSGQVEDIIPCIGCQEACIHEFIKGGHPQCAVNPRTSFEYDMELIPPTAAKKKKIAVIGAGPAGVVCATTLAKRGHYVALVERSDKIGGKIISGSIPKFKYGLNNYRKYLENQVCKAKAKDNFEWMPNTNVDLDWFDQKAFDVIVFANGAKEIALKTEEIPNVRIMDAIDLLLNPNLLSDAKNAIVIGGGIVGCETAYWLKHQYGINVKVIEMLPYLMEHVCTANRAHLIHSLEKADVEILNCTKFDGFEDGKVRIVRNISKTVPDPYVTWSPILPENIKNPLDKKIQVDETIQLVETDIVIMALGYRPENSIYYDAIKNNLADEIYSIGDSQNPGNVFDAVRTGNAIARSI